MSRTLVITGGIGSGKSAVCSIFESRGFPVYDSDSRTKALYREDRELVRRVEDAAGCKVTDGHGILDKAALASAIFSDPARLSAVESVVHPAVLDDFMRWRSSRQEPIVVMESAIILEKPLFRGIADKVLLVDAPLDLRIERACRRDGIPRDMVMKRMSSQKLLNDISEGKIIPQADFVIVNDSDTGLLVPKVEKIISCLLN